YIVRYPDFQLPVSLAVKGEDCNGSDHDALTLRAQAGGFVDAVGADAEGRQGAAAGEVALAAECAYAGRGRAGAGRGVAAPRRLNFRNRRSGRAEARAIVRRIVVELRPERDDARRVDGAVAAVIMRLDMQHVDRAGDAGHLVEVAQVVRQ